MSLRISKLKRNRGKCVGLSPITEFSHSLFAKHLDLRLQGAFLHKYIYLLTRMHSSRMRTGRTLTVFRWNPPKKDTPPENLEEPPSPPKKDTPQKKTPPKNLEEPPKKRRPPKIWEEPPPKDPPPKIWRNPPPKIWRNPPEKLEQNLEHTPPPLWTESQTPVKT